MQGVGTVFHLARANVKSWADYQALEIEATRRVGECALASSAKRLVYTGTIDSYYCGSRQCGDDCHRSRRRSTLRSYRCAICMCARAKAASEEILMRICIASRPCPW